MSQNKKKKLTDMIAFIGSFKPRVIFLIQLVFLEWPFLQGLEGGLGGGGGRSWFLIPATFSR